MLKLEKKHSRKQERLGYFQMLVLCLPISHVICYSHSAVVYSIFLLPEPEEPYWYSELGMGWCEVCNVRKKDTKRYKKRQNIWILMITSSPLMQNFSFGDHKDAYSKPCLHDFFYDGCGCVSLQDNSVIWFPSTSSHVSTCLYIKMPLMHNTKKKVIWKPEVK